MLTRIFCAAVLAAMLTVVSANVRPSIAPLSLDDKKVVTSVDDALLESVLDDLKIDFDKDDTDSTTYTWSVDELSFDLMQFTSDDAEEGAENTELMLQVAIETDATDIDACEGWNESSRFGRVYYSEGSLFIEFDLDVSGGVTVGAIKKYVERFQETVKAVVSELLGEGSGAGR